MNNLWYNKDDFYVQHDSTMSVSVQLEQTMITNGYLSCIKVENFKIFRKTFNNIGSFWKSSWHCRAQLIKANSIAWIVRAVTLHGIDFWSIRVLRRGSNWLSCGQLIIVVQGCLLNLFNSWSSCTQISLIWDCMLGRSSQVVVLLLIDNWLITMRGWLRWSYQWSTFIGYMAFWLVTGVWHWDMCWGDVIVVWSIDFVL